MTIRSAAIAFLFIAAPCIAVAQPADSPPSYPSSAQPSDPAADAAAQRAVRNAIPLTPEMIQQLQQRYGDAQRAQEQGMQADRRPGEPGSDHQASQPGQVTNIVQTVRGYPTAISFFDATGQPWPVGWNTNSNAANLNGGSNCNSTPQQSGGDGSPAVNAVGFYVCVPVKGSNTIEITPMSLVPRGGLVVNLQNAPKPLSFLLIAGQNRYDADMSVHVADRGPNAKVLVDTRPALR